MGCGHRYRPRSQAQQEEGLIFYRRGRATVPGKQGALHLTKRNILCLLLAAALLVQPISLRTWADEVTQQEETVAEESTEAEETEEIIEEPEETRESAEESEPEETLPEETEDWQEPEEDYEEDYEEVNEEVYEEGPFFPNYTLEEYGDVLYGSGTIKTNGCSVCCMAVAATYLTGHQYYPDELARWFGSKAENNVDRLRYMANALHLPMTEAENYNFVKEALWEGKIVIQLMNGKSLFTNSQHFVLLKGINEEGKIMVYDPSVTNRESWRLQYEFENGFSTDEICWGYDGAFIFDPAKMPDDPFIYEPPARPYVEPRYDGLTLTEDETKLLAKLIYVEARGECEDGQQAIAEVVLNRLTSDLFSGSITAMINDESQFVPNKLIKEAKPGQAQYEAIDRALYGPYVLPKDVLFYGRVRTTDSVWGSIGGHIFCYPRGYLAAETN